MKLLILVIVSLFSVVGQASEELRAPALKSKICREIASEIESDPAQIFDGKFDVTACTAGRFTVVKSTYNPTLKMVTLMTVEFETWISNFSVTGSTELALTISTNASGGLIQNWVVRGLKYREVDTRSTYDVVEQYMSDIDPGNGDASVQVVTKLPSHDFVVGELEKMLENYGDDSKGGYDFCRYVNDETPKSVLRSLEEYAPGLGLYLEKQLKQGNIKIAVSRTYDDGPSEYCSKYYFEIYTKDGVNISIQIDMTT